MTVDDIISSLNVIKYYNPNMGTLYDSFVTESSVVVDYMDEVTSADADGLPIYETLVNLGQFGFANAVHDYVYNIIHPLDSITVRNIIREQVCRDLFGLEANF